MTSLQTVYDAFFDQITDDMYMEMTKEETERDCFSFLLRSLPLYEFPKKAIRITSDNTFSRDLTLEEINILALGMMQAWVQRQITNVELTRQKYTGPDFKLTSQAAHLNRLMALQTFLRDEHRRLQMLESRRDENANGEYVSTFNLLVQRKGG